MVANYTYPSPGMILQDGIPPYNLNMNFIQFHYPITIHNINNWKYIPSQWYLDAFQPIVIGCLGKKNGMKSYPVFGGITSLTIKMIPINLLGFPATFPNNSSSWWLNQPIWKTCANQIGIISPRFGMKIKNIWNHKLVPLYWLRNTL